MKGEGAEEAGGGGGGARVGDLRLLFIIFLQHCAGGGCRALEVMYADSLGYISQFRDLQQV